MTMTTPPSFTEEITRLVQQQPRTTFVRYDDTGETPIERFIRLGREVWTEGVSAVDVLVEMQSRTFAHNTEKRTVITITLDIPDELAEQLNQMPLPELLARWLMQPAVPIHVYRHILTLLIGSHRKKEPL